MLTPRVTVRSAAKTVAKRTAVTPSRENRSAMEGKPPACANGVASSGNNVSAGAQAAMGLGEQICSGSAG